MTCKVLVVGDALIDIFLFINTASEHCHVDEKTCEICFTLGAKIPVDDAHFLLGGNACNVAVGLSRLGVRAALITELGSDEFGKKIIAGLRKEHVNLKFLKQTPGSQTSFSVDLITAKDRTILSRHITMAHDIAFETATCSFVYLTSVGETWKPLYKKVSDYVQKNHIQLAFNPGSRQLQAGLASFQNILNITDILFINKEEAEIFVYGHDQKITNKQKNPEVLLQKVQKSGPKRVSMTDGNKGSYAIDTNGKIFFQAIIPAPITQKTGVGDAYATGFLAALLHEKDIQEAMLWGAHNSAGVIQHIGAQAGLLTKEAMQHKIK